MSKETSGYDAVVRIIFSQEHQEDTIFSFDSVGVANEFIKAAKARNFWPYRIETIRTTKQDAFDSQLELLRRIYVFDQVYDAMQNCYNNGLIDTLPERVFDIIAEMHGSFGIEHFDPDDVECMNAATDAVKKWYAFVGVNKE